MVIRRGRPFANDDPEGPASCKWSSRGASLLQMMIQRDWPLANDHPERLASLKWSSSGVGLLQMIILQSVTPVTPITLVTSARIQIQSRRPFWNYLFLFIQKENGLKSLFSFRFKVYGIEGGVKNVKRCQSNKKTIIVCDLPQMFVLAQRVASLCKIIEALWGTLRHSLPLVNIPDTRTPEVTGGSRSQKDTKWQNQIRIWAFLWLAVYIAIDHSHHQHSCVNLFLKSNLIKHLGPEAPPDGSSDNNGSLF